MIFPSGSPARAALGRGAGETGETACFSLLSLPHGPHSLSRIPQGSYSSLPAADIFSPGTRYVISFRWRHLSVPAQWHVSPQPSFQKGSINFILTLFSDFSLLAASFLFGIYLFKPAQILFLDIMIKLEGQEACGVFTVLCLMLHIVLVCHYDSFLGFSSSE